MMKKEVLENILKLLSRVDLKGGEVPAFNEVVQAIQAEMTPVQAESTPETKKP